MQENEDQKNSVFGQFSRIVLNISNSKKRLWQQHDKNRLYRTLYRNSRNNSGWKDEIKEEQYLICNDEESAVKHKQKKLSIAKHWH